jgi:hypothetical protein
MDYYGRKWVSWLITIWLTLATANFAYAAFVSEDWAAALERSFFQFIALVGVWIVVRRSKTRHPNGCSSDLPDPTSRLRL